MAERQASHRQHLEKTVVEGNNRRSTVGMWLGFIIVLVVLAYSGWLIVSGYQLAGTVIAVGDLASVAAVFVYGRREQRQERVEKAEAMAKVRRRLEGERAELKRQGNIG